MINKLGVDDKEPSLALAWMDSDLGEVLFVDVVLFVCFVVVVVGFV